MLAALILFAQDAAPEAAKETGGAPPGLQMLLLPVLFGLFFFMVILPAQRKEKKQRASLLENLKKNDEVLTSSGIIGVVQNLRPEEDEVTVRIDDNCKVRMKKSSIVQIIKSKEEPSAAK